MNKIVYFGLMSILYMIVSTAFAYVNADLYQFDSIEDEKRAYLLAEQLRCPQCQNQNLHDSNSPIAEDMKKKVYTMVDQDYSDEEILSYFTARYGDFVRYRPKLDESTWFLWFFPAIMLLSILIILLLFFFRNKKNETVSLTLEDEKILNKLLKERSIK